MPCFLDFIFFTANYKPVHNTGHDRFGGAAMPSSLSSPRQPHALAHLKNSTTHWEKERKKKGKIQKYPLVSLA